MNPNGPATPEQDPAAVNPAPVRANGNKMIADTCTKTLDLWEEVFRKTGIRFTRLHIREGSISVESENGAFSSVDLPMPLHYVEPGMLFDPMTVKLLATDPPDWEDSNEQEEVLWVTPKGCLVDKWHKRDWDDFSQLGWMQLPEFPDNSRSLTDELHRMLADCSQCPPQFLYGTGYTAFTQPHSYKPKAPFWGAPFGVPWTDLVREISGSTGVAAPPTFTPGTL